MLTNPELLVALLRTTLFASLALVLAWLINRSLRSTAPRFQRIAWTLAIAQSWLLVPLTLQIETAPQEQLPQPTPALAFEPTEAFTVSNRAIEPDADAPSRGFQLETVYMGLCAAWFAGAGSLVV